MENKTKQAVMLSLIATAPVVVKVAADVWAEHRARKQRDKLKKQREYVKCAEKAWKRTYLVLRDDRLDTETKARMINTEMEFLNLVDEY